MTEPFIALKDFFLAVQAVGPWGIVFFIWWQGMKEGRKWEDRFQAVKSMYESNVRLVEDYEKLAKDQHDLIIMNTQAITKLTTIFKERSR